ncbi:MAG: EutN/CcmL family microcompartment protein [Actinobacteria bacterium]|nr:EutN/CcmL family microcompartment protein [Actinomycetota bacterium]
MKLATVVGQVVSTVKDPGLDTLSLLVLRDTGPGAATDAPTFVGVDLVGAGDGDVVLVTTGGAARVCTQTAATPTDCAVVAIVDSVVHQGTVSYSTA